MSDFLTVSYLPDPGVEPRGSFRPECDDLIPAIYLTRQCDGPDLRVQFDPKDLGDAIRYLRQLAAVATDLADRIQNHAAEVVLTP